MKLRLFSTLTCMLLSFSGIAFAEIRDHASFEMQLKSLQQSVDFADDEQDEDCKCSRKTFILENIKYFEKCISKKIKRFESKIVEYNQNIVDSEDSYEAEYWAERVASAEKKIEKLNEVRLGLELLKMRLGA